ncbi:LytR C-terminal domain-containing protein [Kineosporia babensis]|uniref:LytR C-terminal domain-containing protein n=1 Tax=Kineosporia babensis TaxID=499548 RepID=A0A9X1SUM9_9ACTN|nr:LytR C-terminal domain-containing protein [Kineosporia babensis]MCD5312611.1 LytR C-terminal domain-containing protein [Kineosporia babensis]
MTATRPPGYDDRSAAPVEASRRGAHRARPKAIAAILPVIAGVAVVMLVIGAVYTVVGGRTDKAPSSDSAALDEGTDTEASAAPSADKETPKDEESAADESAAPEESETAGGNDGADTGGEETDTKVDKSIEVIVLNSIGINGLAAEYEGSLKGEGWTVKRTGNSTNKDLPVTKIYYGGDELKPTANAVRKAIGVGEISDSPEVNPGDITVVLGQDTQ